MRALLLIAALAAPLAAQAAPTGAAAPVNALTGADLLAAIDVRLTPGLMARYGLDTPALVAALDDVKRPRYARLRALSGLGILGTDAGRDRVRAALQADGDVWVRAEAAVVLARAFAARGDAPALQALRAAQAKQPPVELARVLDEELARLATP